MIIINQIDDAMYNTDNMICIRKCKRDAMGDWCIEIVYNCGAFVLGVYCSETAMCAEFEKLKEVISTPNCYAKYITGGV